MAKNHCNNCQSDISGYRIKCAECPEFDLCLQCFALGAEIGQHKKDHDYRVSPGPVIGAFETEQPWSLAEETMLLDAVEQYGFGNWEDVANHVESRDPTECEGHYNTYFIRGNIGKATFTADSFGKVTDHTCPEGGPLSPSITVPVNPLDLSIQEQHELGYMPFRDDFEREHDNEAETLVSGLVINYDDEELDIAIKLSQVEKYRLRLKERERRKQLARRYGLITAAAATTTSASSTPGSKTPKQQRKRSKEEREFMDKIKPLSQFHSCSEHESFYENYKKEKDLKNRIKELVRLRKNGIQKLDDADEFEEEKFLREKKKEHRKKLGSLAQAKRNSIISKKAAGEEKLDILIDEEDQKGEPVEEEDKKEKEEEKMDTKEMALYPGFDMLSDRERRLCSSIGMTPANYITIKTCIIKDYLQRRQGLPVKIRYPSGMDNTHRRKIMSFLADNGWIGVT